MGWEGRGEVAGGTGEGGEGGMAIHDFLQHCFVI